MKQKTHKQHKQPLAKSQANKPKPEQTPSPQARFSDHISELRKRIFFVALVFMTASALAYNYHDFFVELIMRPLGADGKLVYLTPGGGFNFIFQVSLYVGILAAAPMLMHQLYSFIKPALPERAKRSAIKVVSVSVLLMVIGVLYGYLVAVPSALHFLSNFAGGAITPNLTADSYLSFFLAYIAGLGVLFQLPLLLLFFHWIRPMTPGGLLKSERFIIVFIFIIAAIITPTPDVFNQMMIAGPLLVIYQFGVVAVLIAIKKDKKKRKREEQLQQQVETLPEPTPYVPPVQVTPARPLRQLPIPATPATQSTSRMTQVPPQVAVPRRRSLDGFGPATPARAIKRPVAQQRVSSTPRPSLLSPTPRRRLSIDGFSPVN